MSKSCSDMGSPVQYSGFKKEILIKLKKRNQSEKERFEDIIRLINSLYESLDFYEKENLRLRFQKANPEQDDGQRNSVSFSNNFSDRLSIDRKIALFQEEIAELHKQKGEFASQVISLRSSLDEKEKQLAQKNLQQQELELSLSNSELLCRRLQQKLTETEYNFQLLKDEHDALKITYASMDEKRQKLEVENKDLIARLLALKSEAVERMNSETEMFLRNKQAQLQKELEEAAEEPVVIDIDKRKLCLDAILPKKVQHKFDAHEGEVNAIAWMHTETKFATAGDDHRVKIWDLASDVPSLIGMAAESNSSVYSLDFDYEESSVLAASSDFACHIWGLSDMKIKHTLTGHKGKVMSAKFLAESGQVVSGSHDRTLKLWDLRRRTCMRTILARSSVNDVITYGNTIVSGHFDRKIRFWDIRSESSTNETLFQGIITSLDLSVDGFSLLCSIRDDCLKLIDYRMNKAMKTFQSDGFLVGCNWTRARFSPDGQFCICGSQDGAIFIWKISTGSLEKVLREHSANVIACAWSWCGTYLLSCDKNKKAVLWTEF